MVNSKNWVQNKFCQNQMVVILSVKSNKTCFGWEWRTQVAAAFWQVFFFFFLQNFSAIQYQPVPPKQHSGSCMQHCECVIRLTEFDKNFSSWSYTPLHNGFLRDHSSIMSSWFWPFLTHPPTLLSNVSISYTHLKDDVIISSYPPTYL